MQAKRIKNRTEKQTRRQQRKVNKEVEKRSKRRNQSEVTEKTIQECKTISWHETTCNHDIWIKSSGNKTTLFQRPKMHTLQRYPCKFFLDLKPKLQIPKSLNLSLFYTEKTFKWSKFVDSTGSATIIFPESSAKGPFKRMCPQLTTNNWPQ